MRKKTVKKRSLILHPLAFVLGMEWFVFLPSLLLGGIFHSPFPKFSDATAIFFLNTQFWKTQVMQGILPFWNPHLFAGISFVADPQNAVFYPLNFIFLLPFSLEFTFQLSSCLHMSIAAWGMYRLCRVLGVNSKGSAVGALAFSFSAHFIFYAFSGWIHTLRVASYAPWILWAFLSMVKRMETPRRFVYLFLGGVFLALQLTGGHPEWSYYSLLCLAALTLFVTVQKVGNGAYLAALQCAAGSAGILLLGCLLGAVQLIPTIEATLHSQRGEAAIAGLNAITGNDYPWTYLPTLLIPRLFGPWDFNFSVDSILNLLSASQNSFGETILYNGLLVYFLILPAMRFKSKRVTPWFWSVLAAGSLIFAMNGTFHLKSLLDEAVPFLTVFRNPARIVFITALGFSVLVGMGAAQFIDNKVSIKPGSALYLYLTGVLGLLIGMILVAWPNATGYAVEMIGLLTAEMKTQMVSRGYDPKSLLEQVSKWAGFQVLIFALLWINLVWIFSRGYKYSSNLKFSFLILILSADLLAMGSPFLFSIQKPDGYYHHYEEAVKPIENDIKDCRLFMTRAENYLFHSGKRMVNGYSTFFTKYYADFLKTAEHDPEFLQVMNACYEVTGGLITWRGVKDEAAIKPLGYALPHVYWTSHIVGVGDKDRDAALEVLKGFIADERMGAAVHAKDLPANTQAGSSMNLTMKNGREVELTTSEPGWLVFNEMYYPGWQAEVDGQIHQMLRMNQWMMGVPLEAGDHFIRLRYRPKSVWLGAWISGASLSVCFGFLYWMMRKKKNESTA